MIIHFNKTNSGYEIVAMLFCNNKTIYEVKKFDSTNDRDLDLRIFFGELIAFNYESFTRFTLDKDVDFRQAEARDILMKGNKWFFDNKHRLPVMLKALKKAEVLLRDCKIKGEHTLKYNLFVDGVRRINEWADYVEKSNKEIFN